MYKCSECGCEDKFVYGLLNASYAEGPKRIYITYCECCNTYYMYESLGSNVGSEPVRKVELTKEEAMELIVKMKCCSDPKDSECKCNVHKYINSFRLNNAHRMIAI